MNNKPFIFAIIFVLGLGGLGIWYQNVYLLKSKSNALQSAKQPAKIDNFVDRTFSENRDIDSNQEPYEHTTEVKSSSKAQNVQEPSISLNCDGQDATNFDCYEKYYTELVQRHDTKAAFSDLKSRYETNGYVKSQCHPLTHVIGRISAQKFANVADAYVAGDSFCWSGYYHGVLEGIIGRIGYSNLKNQMNGICVSLAKDKPYSFDHYNCVHGLGHGVMAVNQDELFDALKMCDVLTDTWERSSCWSGVFMENVIIDNKNHFTKFLDPSDPLYPCDAADSQYKNICYLMQTSYMLKVTNGDFTKVFDLCSGIETEHRPTCYESLGRDISGRSSSNVASTKAGCALGKDLEQREHCIIGAVKDFVSYYHSDQQAKQLCAAMTEKAVQDTCYQTEESYYKIF